MDNSLDLLAMIKPDVKNHETVVENAKTALDEVLCHAMSVTQISSEEDRKKIVASIQSVSFCFETSNFRLLYSMACLFFNKTK